MIFQMTEDRVTEQKGFLRYFVISMVLIFVSLLTVRYVKVSLWEKINRTGRELIAVHTIIDETKDLSLALSAMRLGERGYLLTGEDHYLDLTRQHAQTFTTTLSALIDHVGPSTEGGRLLRALEAGFEQLMGEAVMPLLSLRPPAGQSITAEEQVRYAGLMDASQSIAIELTSIIEVFRTLLESDFIQLQRETERLMTVDRRTMIIAPMIIILVMLIAGTYATLRLDRYKGQQQRDQADLRMARDRLAMIITSSNIGTWEWEVRTGIMTINDRFAALIGYQLDELEPFTMRRYERLIHCDDVPRMELATKELLSGERDFYSCDIRLRHKDGHWVWILNQGQSISRDEEGNPLLMIGINTDISDRISAAEELKQREEESRKLFETMSQGFLYGKIIVDDDGRPIDYQILRVNKGFSSQVGVTEAQVVGKRFTQFVTSEDPSVWIEHNGRVALSGESTTFEAFGSYSHRLFRVSSYCPQIGYFAMILEDITQERELERRLDEEKNLFETTLYNIADGVIATDEHALVQFLNPPAEEMTGWQSDEARGQQLGEVLRTFSDRNGVRLPTPFERVGAAHATVTAVEGTILISRDGVQRYIGGKSTPITGPDGAILGTVIIMRDITEERKRQQEILSLSYVDPLTNLNNRRFYDQYRVELDTAEHYPLSLIIADVNGLKLTNDAFGHDVGDTLLQTVGSTLVDVCPTEAPLCRIGGDEFVILLPNSSEREAKAISTRAMEEFSGKRVGDVLVSVSFGYAVKEDEATSFETVFKRAEDVMYQNKLAINLRYKKSVITTILKRLFENYPSLKTHCEQVAFYSSEFARSLGFPRNEIAQMRLAGLYHDIGRVSFTSWLLKKRDEELTKSERIEIKRHAEIGYNILSSVPDYAFIAQAVLHHHERWDGRGYPQALKGNAIPRPAQILGIANFFVDVLEIDGASEESARQELIEREGTYFDPHLIRHFIEHVIDRTPVTPL